MLLGMLKSEAEKIPYFSVRHKQSKKGQWSYNTEFSLGEEGEGILFHSLGVKDQLAVEGQKPLGAFNTVSLEVDRYRYRTHFNEVIGMGWRGYLQWDHKLMIQPLFQTTAYARYVKNQLVADLASTVSGLVVNNLDRVLAKESTVLGVDLLFQKGVESLWGHRYSGLFYRALTGIFYTNINVGYRIDLSLGGRVFGKDSLNFNFSYSDASDGVSEETTAVGWRYSYNFD